MRLYLNINGQEIYEDYEEITATDVGNWEMTVFNDNGGTDIFFGSLIETDHNYVEDESISDIIRENSYVRKLFGLQVGEK